MFQLPPLLAIYMASGPCRKALALLALALTIGTFSASPLEGQFRRRRADPEPGRPTTHEVVLRRIERGDETGFVFAPQEIRVRPGDRIRFAVESGGPHSVVIADAGLERSVAEAWNQALPRRVGPYTSPLLVEPETVYEITVPRVPAGRYRYYCRPHRAYRMDGVIVVVGG